MAVPLLWDRICVGFSGWLAQTAERQRSVEKLVAEKNRRELVQQHSATDESDPCKLDPYNYELSGLNGDSVSRVETIAKGGKTEDAKKVEASESLIKGYLNEFDELKLPDLVSQLEREKQAEWQEMQSFSDSLEQIVSTDRTKRLGKEEVLTAVHGKETVESMPSDAKDKAYKKLKANRIAQRAMSATKGAEKLYTNNSWKGKLQAANNIKQNIMNQRSCTRTLHARSDEALAKKKEVESIVLRLEDERQSGEGKRAKCKSQKLNVNKQLSAKRDEFKKALQHIQAIEQEYQDLHITHEALRLQSEDLDEQLAKNRECLESAKARSLAATQACDAWQQSNDILAKQMDETITSKTNDVVERGLPCAQKVADGLCLAVQILLSQMEDEQVRMSGITSNIEANKQELDTLHDLVDAGEADDDDFTKLATCQDNEKMYMDQRGDCTKNIEELQKAKDSAHVQWQLLKGLQDYGEAIDEQETMKKAFDLTPSFYKKLPVYAKAKQVKFDEGKKKTSKQHRKEEEEEEVEEKGGELVAFSPAQMEMINRMIEEKARVVAEQKFQQMRADELFRNRDGARSESSWADLGEPTNSTAV